MKALTNIRQEKKIHASPRKSPVITTSHLDQIGRYNRWDIGHLRSWGPLSTAILSRCDEVGLTGAVKSIWNKSSTKAWWRHYNSSVSTLVYTSDDIIVRGDDKNGDVWSLCLRTLTVVREEGASKRLPKLSIQKIRLAKSNSHLHVVPAMDLRLQYYRRADRRQARSMELFVGVAIVRRSCARTTMVASCHTEQRTTVKPRYKNTLGSKDCILIEEVFF